MAAKKTRASKKTAKRSSSSPESVTVMLDTETILVLQAAVEALQEFASAVTMGSSDPAVRAAAQSAKKSSKKSAKKRAKKSSK